MSKTKRSILAAFGAPALAAASLLAAPTSASAAPSAESCAGRTNSTYNTLLECVTLEGVRRHQQALQAIANANGGTRASGSPGYDRSADYVADKLRAAGYSVIVQTFAFRFFISQAPSVLRQVAPLPEAPIDHIIMSYSGSGDVTAAVSLPSGDSRGCTAGAFAGFPAGNVALIERGTPPGSAETCTFAIKATNAYNAGAAGAVIYNNAAGALGGTLGESFNLDIPVVGISQATGQQLAATPGLRVHLQTSTLRGTTTTANVLAESRTGDPNNVIMAGAHLDSVGAGPGINDNGSGSAAILEVALQMAKVKPRNLLRFAWWGAEESNLVGSTYYVTNLSSAERDRIALYLNFDMIGSPNYGFFIYDGDDSDGVGAGPGPEGSAQIEKVFETFYTQRGLPFKGTDFSGRSDYGPFIAVGIPSGGLFTGAEGVKTAAEVALWGGTAGVAYDPCYHQACDTADNVSNFALEVNADAVAYAVLTYAGLSQVNRSKRAPFKYDPEFSGPALRR